MTECGEMKVRGSPIRRAMLHQINYPAVSCEVYPEYNSPLNPLSCAPSGIPEEGKERGNRAKRGGVSLSRSKLRGIKSTKIKRPSPLPAEMGEGRNGLRSRKAGLRSNLSELPHNSLLMYNVAPLLNRKKDNLVRPCPRNPE
jgi:hypothetical protein